MKKYLVITIILTIAPVAYAQRAPAGEIGTFRFVEKKGGHTYRLVFRTKAFNRSGHKITHTKQLFMTVVDGRTAFGTDGGAPGTEIESVAFYFDGKKINVPRSLYADCFEPSFGKDYFAVKAGDDGGSLLVFMAGGDAAGSYQVIWVLRKDGHHSRFSTPCSDCDYTGFLTFFIDQFANTGVKH